jgi:multiple sugar transport system substrate-binding protein
MAAQSQRAAEPSRRKFLQMASTAIAGAGMAACGAPLLPASRRPTARVDTDLTYQDTRTGWFVPMVQEALDQFHAGHPGIRVFFVPEPENPKDIEEKTLTAMETGMAADVLQGCCSWLPIWAQRGHMLDLRPYVAADLDQATIADWSTAQYRAFFTEDGRQYALPKYHGGLALYYNKDLFDASRVDYPEAGWTHDDYLAAMKRLTRDRDGDGKTDLWGSMTYISWDRLQIHVNGWGGHLMDPNDHTRCLMDRPEALAALDWLHAAMWDDQVMATSLQVHNLWPCDAFADGLVAMVEDGSWQLKSILSRAKFRVGVAPFPAGPARQVTLATTDGFGIYAKTRHPDAAWELLKYLIGKDFGRAMAKANLLQPARASLVEEWVDLVRQQFPEQTKGMDIAAFADGHVKGYSVVSEVAANMAEATRIATAAWDAYFTFGSGTLDLIKQAARAIEVAQHS